MLALEQVAKNPKVLKPVIYGLSGQILTDQEKDFFSKAGPLGFILFSRNIENRAQLKRLTAELKELMEGEILILTDQEGGRVARLKGKDWQEYPKARHFSTIYTNSKEAALDACFKNYLAIASDLAEVGINLNCAPVLDISYPETHEIISDRSFGTTAEQVSKLGKAACLGLLAGGVYPVIKHIPGHGRATADSHLALPEVTASLNELTQSDFIPFQKLADMKFAMTAHILYSAIDNQLPATISPTLINLIRENIGFKNILMSDDINMKALPGSLASRSTALLEAGCDIVLHCSGTLAEMEEINQVLPPLLDSLREKFITKLEP